MIATRDLRSVRVTGQDLVRVFRELLQSHADPLLTMGARPWRRWYPEIEDREVLVLSTAPHFEMLFWLPAGTQIPKDTTFEEECAALFTGYQTTLDCGTHEATQAYASLLHQHIEQQNEQLYPQLLSQLDLQRPIRELGYEHDGLLKTYSRLCDELECSPDRQLSGKRREQYDLDFYHLLEHHLERERDALIPLRNFLAQG